MFQPAAKLAFVSRYCSPADGWCVYVDIDASELGETGGARKSPEAVARQKAMQSEGHEAMAKLSVLGATVRGPRAPWFATLMQSHPQCGGLVVPGDRDIVAVHPEKRRLIVAEVEGESSGQPEAKLYKAIGQAVMAASETEPGGLDASFVVVVYGNRIAAHLRRATVLEGINVSGVSISLSPDQDEWILGDTRE